MSILGDVRPGEDFKFTHKTTVAAPTDFVCIKEGKLFVTRHAVKLFDLPDDTPVVAHWHGQWRTDAFATSVGQLKVKAKEYVS